MRNQSEGIPVGGAGQMALFGLLWELNQVELGGLEPPASTVRLWRSPN